MRTILTFVLCAAALTAADAPRRAPGFALPAIGVDGHVKFHDLADYRGKVLVLEFMATTCPHCAAFADALAKIPQKYGDKVAVLAVANVNGDTPAKVAQYSASRKVTYPIVMDQGQMMFSYVQSAQGADLPHVYVIDASGYIRADYAYDDVITRDIFDGDGLFRDIDRVLKQSAVIR